MQKSVFTVYLLPRYRYKAVSSLISSRYRSGTHLQNQLVSPITLLDKPVNSTTNQRCSFPRSLTYQKVCCPPPRSTTVLSLHRGDGGVSTRTMSQDKGATESKSKVDEKEALLDQEPKTADKAANDADSIAANSDVQPKKLSTGERLKLAVRDYGGTVLVFHITMSLMSLGSCYLIVSSGLDIIGLLGKLGISESLLQSKIAQGGSTFVLAYAIHKVFAPVRLGITLTAVPFIVKKLRSAGYLKKPV